MKKYVLFCYNITGMGGGQQFVYTKAKFLSHNGFDVTVFSTIESEIVIEGLKQYEKYIWKELKYPPCSFRKRAIDSIVKKIVKACDGEFDEILIESDGGYETQWAEIVAKELNAQHIIFSVAEQQNKRYSEAFLDYLYFKYKRQELYGITTDSIKLLFKGYRDIRDSERYAFTATCNNVVDIYNSVPEFPIPEADINIAGIWRTNKEGFVECIHSIVPFVKQHEDKTFNIIIIGAGSQENERKAKDFFAGFANVNFIITGFMYPIPKSFIEKMDVFVSTAGSSRIPIKYGKPSISVTSSFLPDGSVKLYPLGILNYTTSNTVVPEDTGLSTSELLEKVVIEGFCDKHDTLGMERVIFDEEKELQLELSRFGNVEIEYYDMSVIKPSLRIEKGYALIGRLLGPEVLFMTDKIGHDLKSRK